MSAGGTYITATLVEEIRESSADFLRGKALAVYGATFSPDGSLLAYGVRGISGEGHTHGSSTAGMRQRHFTLKLRETSDLFPKLPSAPQRATPGGLLAFALDGSRLASASERHVDLWTLPEGRQFATRDYPFNVNAVAFSPDSRWLACALSSNILAAALGGNSIMLWEVGAANPMLSPLNIGFRGHRSAVNAVAFSPDGKTLASTSSDRSVKIWRMDGDMHAEPPITVPGVYGQHLAFSPGGEFLALGCEDGTVVLWEVKAVWDKPSKRLLGHRDPVRHINFSPDGNLLASASDDTTIRLWEMPAGRSLGAITGHKAAVNAVSFAPNGQFLASTSLDNTLKIWRPG